MTPSHMGHGFIRVWPHKCIYLRSCDLIGGGEGREHLLRLRAIFTRALAYEGVMAHAWMSHGHGTYMNESWNIYEWVMAHIWMSHGTHISERALASSARNIYTSSGVWKETWHTCKWVMAHIWMSHGTYLNESWHTCQRESTCLVCAQYAHELACMKEWWRTWESVMAHVWMSRGTYINESWHTCQRECPWVVCTQYVHELWCMWRSHGTRDVRTSHGTRVNESWHKYEWVMAHIWMRRGAHIWMNHGTYMNESWHIYEWVMAHIWMSHGTCMNASWRGAHMYEPCRTYEWDIAHIWMNHGAQQNESWHTYEWVLSHTYTIYLRTLGVMHRKCVWVRGVWREEGEREREGKRGRGRERGGG